ncbi:MAG: serine/threonine-protein kinase [Gemmatimonadales bacterium]
MSDSAKLLWQRWHDADQLLDRVLEVPADRRAAELARLVGEDGELEALVLRLLARLDETGGRLAAPAPGVVAGAFKLDAVARAALEDLEPGAVVDRYRVTRRLGRGGMATVYEAVRADGVYSNRAALKVLRRGLDTEDVVRRFLDERQILSRLRHPNIAQLLDGGSLADGRPYLVMELVEGERITDHADRLKLGVPDRLDLFLQVAEAVSAAHRQLVVHRDIKPSNVLVDGDGRVALLDFGIAKLMDGDGEHTTGGIWALTPDYASPEQLAGLPITTVSDVYQLGLLLRELLTGIRPRLDPDRERPLLSTRPSRLATRDTNGSPPPAERASARRTVPDRLAAALAGDLDLIIAMAVRAEPAARYPSVDELAADVRRFLKGQPVRAHPESTGYRLRKFARRNPVLLPAVAVMVLLVAGFITMLATQNRRLERERDLARAATTRAQETQDFLVDVLGSPDPWRPADPDRGRNISVVDALELSTARVRTELADQPELRSALLATIGRVMMGLDRPAEAESLLREAVATRAAAGDDSSAAVSEDLRHLADALSQQDRLDTAHAVLERRLVLERARRPVDGDRLGSVLLQLAELESLTGTRDSAERLAEGAVAVVRAANGSTLAGVLQIAADIYRANDHLERSEAAARESAAILHRRGVGGATLAVTLHSLAQTLGIRGEVAEARRLFDTTLVLLDATLGPDDGNTISVRNNYAVLLSNAGDNVGAERLGREVLASAMRRHGGEGHSRVADAFQNLAAYLLRQGRFQEAVELTQRAEAIYRAVVPGSPRIGITLLSRTEIELRAGDYRAAARSAAEAAAIFAGRLSVASAPVVMADCRLGRALLELRQQREAVRVLGGVAERLPGAQLGAVHRIECEATLAAAGIAAPGPAPVDAHR